MGAWSDLQIPSWPRIGPWSLESIGLPLMTITQAGPLSGAWPSASVAIYVPLGLYSRAPVTRLWTQNGGTVSGNFDVGVYDEGGTRIVSTGSIAHAGTSTLQYVDITDVLLGPGLFYLAMAVDNTTAQFGRGATNAQFLRACGVFQQASAFPLPATATFATMAQAYLPNFGLAIRDTI